LTSVPLRPDRFSAPYTEWTAQPVQSFRRSRRLGLVQVQLGQSPSLQCRGKDLLHDPAAASATRVPCPLLVAPAVRPDGVHDATERGDALVVALLVAVVDARAGKETVAVVLVGLRVGDAKAGCEVQAVRRPREKHVGFEIPAGAVVARVVVRDVDLSGD